MIRVTSAGSGYEPTGTAPRAPAGPYPMGLMGILATVAMLFAAFTAALLVRRTGLDWVPVTLPAIVWANTVVLIASSAVIEVARAAVRRDAGPAAARYLQIGALLGGLFLVGQIGAWRALVEAGVLLPTNPHASFFYMLSAVHGLHVVGGIGALTWTWRRTLRGAYRSTDQTGLLHAAVYWHFVGIVWVYVLALLVTL